MLRAATAKPAGQSFGDVLAQSAKTKPHVATADSLAQAVSAKEQPEENARRQFKEQAQITRERSGSGNTAKSNRAGKTSGQRARLAQNRSELHQQLANAGADDEAPEKVTAAHTDDEGEPGAAEDKSVQTSTLQNNMTGVAASPATDASNSEQAGNGTDNGADGVTPVEGNAQTVDPIQGNAQSAAGLTGAADRANGTQHVGQRTSEQQDVQTDAVDGEAQDADVIAQSAGTGTGNPGIAAESELLVPFAVSGPESVQAPNAANDTGSTKQSSVELGPADAALANAASGLTALQDTSSGIHAVSTLQATGNPTGDAHSNSTGSQTADQAARHSQADVSQAGTPALHTELASLLQTTAAQHAEPRGTAGTHVSNVDMAAQSAATNGESLASQASGTAQAGMSGISTARLIQTMTDTEMRVGIHSNEFGTISVRTTVTAQQMQAQIAVGHSDLGTAIAAHIPSIQAKLGSDYGLQASISVNANGAGFSDNGHSRTPQQTTAPSLEAGELQDAVADVAVAQLPVVTGSAHRLDIRA